MDRAPILILISIRTVKGDPILSTTIDYDNCSLAEMKTMAAPYLARTPETFQDCQKRMVGTFRKHYKGGRCHGKSLLEIKNNIRTLGYNETTHTLISWGSEVDLRLFNMIMRTTTNQAIHPCLDTCRQQFNITKLCQEMLPLRNSAGSSRLDWIHPRLCPNHQLVYHFAEADTQTLAEVISSMVHA